jgi:predicted nicotinamide N-methyase
MAWTIIETHYQNQCQFRQNGPRGARSVARSAGVQRERIHDVAGLRLAAPDVEVGRRSVFAHLWPAGQRLAEQVAGPLAAEVRGRDVIELGCGLGAPGLAAARAGARAVLTDVEDGALALARANAAVNRLDVDVRRLRWGDVDRELRGRFAVVLGADVTYDPAERGALLATIEALLAPGGVAWLADPERTSRRELLHHTRLTIAQALRLPSPPGLATSDDSGARDVVIYRLAAG